MHSRAACAETSSLFGLVDGLGAQDERRQLQLVERARRAATTGCVWCRIVGFFSAGWPYWPLTTAPSSSSPGEMTVGRPPDRLRP